MKHLNENWIEISAEGRYRAPAASVRNFGTVREPRWFVWGPDVGYDVAQFENCDTCGAAPGEKHPASCAEYHDAQDCDCLGGPYFKTKADAAAFRARVAERKAGGAR